MTVIVTGVEGFPSELAVIVAVPAMTPVTTPLVAFTDAMFGDPLVHVMARPVSAFPRESSALAVSVRFSAMRIVVFDGGSIVTVDTAAGVTVTCADADWLAFSVVTVAVIVALPALTPVTTPFATEAMFDAELDHVVVDSVQFVCVTLV